MTSDIRHIRTASFASLHLEASSPARQSIALEECIAIINPSPLKVSIWGSKGRVIQLTAPLKYLTIVLVLSRLTQSKFSVSLSARRSTLGPAAQELFNNTSVKWHTPACSAASWHLGTPIFMCKAPQDFINFHYPLPLETLRFTLTAFGSGA